MTRGKREKKAETKGGMGIVGRVKFGIGLNRERSESECFGLGNDVLFGGRVSDMPRLFRWGTKRAEGRMVQSAEPKEVPGVGVCSFFLRVQAVNEFQ